MLFEKIKISVKVESTEKIGSNSVVFESEVFRLGNKKKSKAGNTDSDSKEDTSGIAGGLIDIRPVQSLINFFTQRSPANNLVRKLDLNMRDLTLIELLRQELQKEDVCRYFNINSTKLASRIHRLCDKLGVTTETALVLKALKSGLI